MSDVNTQIQAISQQPYLFNNVPIPYTHGPYAQNPLLSSLVNSQTGHNGHAMSRTLNPHQTQLTSQALYPNSASYLSIYPNVGIPPTGHPSSEHAKFNCKQTRRCCRCRCHEWQDNPSPSGQHRRRG